jgi:hypothetical protein
MSERDYHGNFNQSLSVSHGQVASSDNVDIDCGYISFIRKITFGTTAGTVRLSFFDDAARTSLVYRSNWMSNGDSDISPIAFVDTAGTSKIYAKIEGTPSATITLAMKIIRMA